MHSFKRLLGQPLFVAAALGLNIFVSLATSATAQTTVKIGAVYPLSGNSANAGLATKAAIEVAVDIINNAHPEFGELTLAKETGLPGLNGARVEVIFADNQGNPAVGQNQALRLITQERVNAMVGSTQSGLTSTASAIAERHGIPFLNPESTAPMLTERGFKWFFRTTPMAADISQLYMDFLKDLRSQGTKVDRIAVVNENTEYGTSLAKILVTKAKENGFDVSVQIPYGANSTDVQSQVLQLRDNNPDVAIFLSYTSDAILYVKTMQSLGYKPPILIGDDSGFSDPSFLKAVGPIAQGVLNRSAFDIGKPGSVSFKVNEMFKKKTGDDLDDTSGRAMQGFLTLVDAINRAGSTDPEKVQAALKATDLKPNQLMIGYKGVKFDEKGQNILASSLMIQVHGDKYVAVWPKENATEELKLPYKAWTK